MLSVSSCRRTCFAHVGPFLNGTARFSVAQGCACIEVSGLLRLFSRYRSVGRKSGEIVVIRYRLRPFWGSTVVYLDEEAWAAIGWRSTRSAIGALREAGFVVHEHRALLTKPAVVRTLGLRADRVRV